MQPGTRDIRALNTGVCHKSNPSEFMEFVVATLGMKTAVQFEGRNVVLIL